MHPRERFQLVGRLELRPIKGNTMPPRDPNDEDDDEDDDDDANRTISSRRSSENPTNSTM